MYCPEHHSHCNLRRA
jgi:hypothetical protein